MRRIVLRPKKLYKLAREFIHLYSLPNENISNGGRPKAYSDALILTIMSIQKLGRFSFRETLEYCEAFFQKVPSLSSYYERIEIFPKKLFRKFIAHLGT